MRSLSILFRLLVAGVVLASLVFFGGREAVLFYSVTQLNNHIAELRLLSKNPASYTERCKTTFASYSDDEALSGFQLRFTDDTQYRTEAVCQFHEKEPILIKQGKLEGMVRRTAGYSGLFFGSTGAPTALGIELLGRTAKVGSEGATSLPVDSPELVSPAASCSGFGFRCCDPIQDVSTGTSVGDKALDCPGRCFRSCKSRPVVLSFRSDPPLLPTVRSVTLQADAQGKAELVLTYVVSDPDGTVQGVQLDYGDGQSETFAATEMRATHMYSCAKPGSCTFTATVGVTDNEGYTSPQGEATKITVRM